MSTITIANPQSGATVSYSFSTNGTVNPAEGVIVTLQSSLTTVLAVSKTVDGSTGNWNCGFAVDPSSYPGNSTLTATIVGTSTTVSIQVDISNVAPGGGGG
jgi:hypothetical protein